MLASARLLNVPQAWVMVVGDVVDFATAHSQPFGADWLRQLPPQPGFTFMPMVGRMLVASQAGAHVANTTIQIGTNGSINNIINVSTATAANINLSIAIPVLKNDPILALSINSVQASPELDGTVPTVFVGAPITAGCTFTAVPYVWGIVVPLF